MSECKDLVIVGGGLSGILLALKISNMGNTGNTGNTGNSERSEITLIDEQPTLGGRLFFASSHSASGFGFEFFNLQTKESLFRHIQNSLTEEENNELTEYLSKFEDKGTIQHSCYFVKKELTTFHSLLNGSSELLTKKESEYLKLLITDSPPAFDVSFKKGDIIKIFEVVVGLKWDIIPFSECCSLLKQFFCEEKNLYLLAFQRNVAIETFLGKVLLDRGIEIRNLCKLVRVEQINKETFNLTLNDELRPENKYLQTKQLVLAIPLAKCAGILPKEIYSPEQSKFISKIQPLSLVVYELTNFSNLKSPSLTINLNSYDKLIFPVERAKAFYTADDRILFYTELDYEDSLQAPAVREAVGRLKRSASRLLNEDVSKELKKGFRMPLSHFSERVILLPVAQSVPYYTKMNFELKQGNMGVPHLYCCGDSFFSLADEPWKRLIHSVNDIAHLLI